MKHPALALLVALGCSTVASAQDAPMQEIIVTADQYRAAQKFLNQVVRPSGDRMATWQDAVCVSVKGFAAPQAASVVEYIHETLRKAGGRIARPGCSPNVAITMVADGDFAAQDLLDNKQFMLGERSQRTLRDLARSDQPVRWIHLDQITTDAGAPSSSGPVLATSNNFDFGAPTIRSYGTASHNLSPTRVKLQRVIAIVDGRFTTGISLRQLSAYLAMGTMLRLQRDADQVDKPSILTLFRDVQAKRGAQPDLTEYDRALLQALYRARPDLNGEQQYNNVTNEVAAILKNDE